MSRRLRIANRFANGKGSALARLSSMQESAGPLLKGPALTSGLAGDDLFSVVYDFNAFDLGVTVSGCDDFVQYRKALVFQLTEEGMQTVQMGSVHLVDEKLRAIGIGS